MRAGSASASDTWLDKRKSRAEALAMRGVHFRRGRERGCVSRVIH
jgi:hypothetical protein